jgi:hypothetical protein
VLHVSPVRSADRVARQERMRNLAKSLLDR